MSLFCVWIIFLLLELIVFIQRLNNKCAVKGEGDIYKQSNDSLLVVGIGMNTIIVSFLSMNAIMVNFITIAQQNKQKNLLKQHSGLKACHLFHNWDIIVDLK